MPSPMIAPGTIAKKIEKMSPPAMQYRRNRRRRSWSVSPQKPKLNLKIRGRIIEELSF